MKQASNNNYVMCYYRMGNGEWNWRSEHVAIPTVIDPVHSVNGRELNGQILAIYEAVQNMDTKADIPRS